MSKVLEWAFGWGRTVVETAAGELMCSLHSSPPLWAGKELKLVLLSGLVRLDDMEEEFTGSRCLHHLATLRTSSNLPQIQTCCSHACFI